MPVKVEYLRCRVGERIHSHTDEELKRRKEQERDRAPMKIKMLTTHKGSPDGIKIFTYEAGKTYELPASLASIFLREGWAIKSGGKKNE